MADGFIASARVKQSLKHLLLDPPNCVGLVGERGVGKGHTARYITSKLLEVSIAKIDIHPHFIHLDASDTGIDEIRELQSSLKLSVPGSSTIRRVVVIEHFQLLGIESQNALLKTLEEPPLSTLIILTIDNLSIVLPTIASRLQLFEISPVSYSLAAEANPGYAEADLKRAYNISGGSIGLMSGILEGDASHEVLKAIESAREVLKLPKYQRIGMIDRITKNQSLSVVAFLDGLSRLLYASLKQSLVSGNSSLPLLQQSNNRIRLVVQALDDINSGAGQKLVLTRLFLAL